MELNWQGPLLLVQLVSCALLTGLIWTIQILHYPAFARIAADQFIEFHAEHSRNITFIVGPWMLLELGAALALCFSFKFSWISSANLISVGLIWLSTLFLSIPIHNQLSQGLDLQQVQALVATNWPRTLLWSIRLVGVGGWTWTFLGFGAR